MPEPHYPNDASDIAEHLASQIIYMHTQGGGITDYKLTILIERGLKKLVEQGSLIVVKAVDVR